jgi:Tol biopolymer transport system component
MFASARPSCLRPYTRSTGIELAMGLASGTRLGAYEVLGHLGSGGMGEVYRARDARLGRDVAIKALPAEVAQDAERLARFRREAQLLASLNHPHVAGVHGLEELDGNLLLVLELVEGEDLAQRLKRGALPVDEALEVARQIAEALEEAHAHGIVHRDLKPANIKLTPDGKVKVLDFGLAKAYAPDASGASTPDSSRSPTLTRAGTGAGVILGTASYMSPEQARGKPVDKRADIWAFGVVLYEMLTGTRLFHGETNNDTLAAVLKEEPDLSRAPDRVRRLLRACLQRDPKQRLQAIGDAWLLLEDGAVAAAHARRSRVAWVVAAGAVFVATLAIWTAWRRPVSNAAPAAIRLDLELGAAVAPDNVGADAIVSPDGTRLVFVAQGPNGRSRLLTRRLDLAQAVELRGSEGAYSPFFSPDGRWVGYFAGGKLKKTPVEGGEPVVLCPAPAGRGGAWTEDGSIIAALSTQAGLSILPAAGGSVVPLTTLLPSENSHRWPQALPGGRTVLFSSNTTYANFDEASISVLSLADRKWKVALERAGMYPRYLPSGHLLYVTKGTLFAVPFDAVRGKASGRPAVVLEDVSNDTTFGYARLDVSAGGLLLYRRGRTEGDRTVHWMDSAGRLEPLETDPAVYQFPRVSPDGGKVVWMVNEGPIADLWIYDWRRGTRTRLTDGKDVYSYPVWSPDGRYVVLGSPRGVFWTRADGAGRPESLLAGSDARFPTSFAPDGRRLVYSERTPTGAIIQTVLVDESAGLLRARGPEPFLPTLGALPFSAFSPDGRWLAYADAESGRYELYVRAFPDKGRRWLISIDGGTMPVWSRNGRELFYRSEDNRIMVATYTTTGDVFAADKPRAWSERKLANTGLTPNFDLAPDGKRVVVLMPAAGSEPPPAQSHVTLVANFLDELQRLAPAK